MRASPTRAFYGWQIVVAALVGTALSPATLINVPFSLFIAQLQQAFAWSRPQITLALSAFLLLLVVALPIAGQMVDRIGARRIVIPSIVLYGVTLGSLSLLDASRFHLYLLYGAMAVLGAGAQSLTYIRVISCWFDHRRGLVIGICMAGYGLGYIVVPMVTQALIFWGGWRCAYAGLGALALGGALPTVALLLHDTPRKAGLEIDGEQNLPRPGVESSAEGSTFSCAARSLDLWLLAASFLTMSFALNGVQSQFVPLLTDRGMTAAGAAAMLSAIGIGSFPGRLGIGFTIDKIFAPFVAFACYAAAGISVLWLMHGHSTAGVCVSAIGVGVGLGAENDVLGYLVGRYFGLRSFGQIYGVLLGVYLVGAAIGAYVSAQVHEVTGSYASALRVDAAAIVTSCGLLLLLSRYDRGVPTQ